MSAREVFRLSPDALLRRVRELVERERANTSELLLHLGEVERRRLYRAEACSSMFDYCVRRLGLSEYETVLRLRAARVARRYPQVLAAVADGRLHLSAIARLAPVLDSRNAADLLRAAEHRTKSELDALLAERFPRPDAPTTVHLLVPVAANVTSESRLLGPDPVKILENFAISRTERSAGSQPAMASADGALGSESAPEATLAAPTTVLTAAQTAALLTRGRLTPLAPERVALQVTLSRETHAKLARAQELLAHTVCPGDIAAVLDRALELLVAKLEQRRTGALARSTTTTVATSGPAHADERAKSRRPRAASSPVRSGPRPSGNSRHVPAAVRRAVWARDGHRCTFVSASGQRCESRAELELDHVRPFACGGENSVENLRLRCFAHNQLGAEHAYGEAFMAARRAHGEVREDAAFVSAPAASRPPCPRVARGGRRGRSPGGSCGSAAGPSSRSPGGTPRRARSATRSGSA